jgi:hypothetical protein
MKIEKINVEDGLYDRKLLECLWYKKPDNDFDKIIIQILKKLIKKGLIRGEDKVNELSLSDKEIDILNNIDIVASCENKEIVARWCDYIQELDKNKRPNYIKQCCANYLEIYKTTGNYEYLVRRLQLIRKAKGLFTTELEEICKSTRKVITISDAPYWQKQLLTELVVIFGTERCQKYYSTLLEEKIEAFNEKEKFLEARHCIDSLHIIKKLNDNQWHVRISENFEKEGDWIVNNKKTNTYYPNLSEIYLKGLREINSVADCDSLRQRLERKVAEAKRENYDMIRTVGIPMTPPVDYIEIYKVISGLNINGFTSAYNELVSMPIVPESIIIEYVNISKNNSSPITELFSQTVKIDHKGAKIGSATGEDVHINNARSFIRERSIALIKGIKNIMDIHKQIDRAFVFGLLEQCNGKFVPEGINEGFNNNFISAAHLLVPQLENSFRYIALQNGVETTKWSDDLQHQNVFGGSLEKIKDFTKSDLHKELHNFLVNSNVNFRNELCHGLISPILIEHYGSYLWWLTLKMVLQTENYFSFT